MTGLHILLASVAIAAGGSFAAGGVLQQRAASYRPEREAPSVRLVVGLGAGNLIITAAKPFGSGQFDGGVRRERHVRDHLHPSRSASLRLQSRYGQGEQAITSLV